MSSPDRTTPEPAPPQVRSPVASNRDGFVAELAARRAASGKSFSSLARELDHPRSTLHGWCRGDHLPFPRDDPVFERLLRSIGVDDPAPWLATLRHLRGRGSRVNPYRGLDPYTEDDTDHFHGRDALTERLVAAIDGPAASHPLVVIGASGSGKTSLLRAGLLGRLRRRPGHATAAIAPGDDPSERVCAAMASVAGARAATIVIDQFEELFTIAPDAAVGPTVAAISAAQRSGIRVVIGVRADFFHDVASVPYLLEALDRGQIVVGPMSTEELTDAIVAPASLAGFALTPSLVAHLVQEFDEQAHRARGSHVLPLLSHVLFRLADRAAGDTIGLPDYLALGGLRDSLQQSADEALAAVPAELHDSCRRLFLQLVELGEAATPTRRAATRSVLAELASPEDVAVVLDAFVSRRLLTAEHDAVTLSHEALLSAWPTLRDWVDGERNQLLVRRRVQSAHRLWCETGSPADGLLRGTLLDEAVGLLHGPLRSTLDEAERGFVDASVDALAAAHARDAEVLARQIAAQSDLLGARDPSLSGHLAIEAIGVADTVEARSAILRCRVSAAGPRFVGPTGSCSIAAAPRTGRVVAAFASTGDIEIYEAVEGILARTPELGGGLVGGGVPSARVVALDEDGDLLVVGTRDGGVILLDGAERHELTGVVPGEPVHAVVADPAGNRVVAAGAPGVVTWRRRDDGWFHDVTIVREATTAGVAVRWHDTTIATASNDGDVSLWNPDGTHRWSADVRAARPIAGSVAFSPDGSTLAAGYHDGSVRIWTLSADPVEHPLGSAPFATWVNAIDFSPDGVLLAAASSDGTVRLWDTATWREQRVELRHPSVVSGVRFTGDRQLVTSSEDGIVRTWDVSRAITGSEASIWSLRFDATGTTMVTSSRRQLSIGRLTAGGWVHDVVPAPEALQLFSGVCDITEDATLAAAGTRSGAVLLVDVPTARPIGHLTGDLGPLVEGLVVRSERRPGAGRQSDPAGSGRAATITAHSERRTVVAAVDSGGRLHRWLLDRSAHEVVPTDSTGALVSMGTALGIADFGDGLVGVTTEPGELVVVDIAGDELVEVSRFRTGEAFPICAARRPGHDTIVTGGADRAVSVWSVADWQRPELVTRLLGPAGHVMAVDIDATGSRLAAGTTDGRLWIWTWDDAPDLWATIETGEAGVYAVRFSPDGRHLLSAGPNERITWWPLDIAIATAELRRTLGDPLSDHERSRLVPGPR